MAVGNGGFSTKAMGFDKNEVNEYISNLRKKMNELTAEMKANAKTTEEAVKTAEAADARVKAAEEAGEKKAEELSEQLAGQQSICQSLRKEIEEFKLKLEEEKRKMSDMLKNGRGISAEAKRAYSEITDKANADAAEIIRKAEETAAGIISEAESKAAATNERLTRFMALLSEQLNVINCGYKAVNNGAAEILGKAVDVSEFDAADLRTSVSEAAVAAEDYIKPVDEAQSVEMTDAVRSEKVKSAAPVEETVAEPLPVPAAPQPAPVSESEPAEEEPETDEIVFGNGWGGEPADNKQADNEPEEVPEDVFNNALNDMFNTSNSSDDDMSTDLSGGFGDFDSIGGTDDAADGAESILPIDNSDFGRGIPDNDFTSDLLAQTMNSSSLHGVVDDNVLSAVKEAERAFEVQPADTVGDVSMDDLDDDGADAEDELMKTLRSAEAALSSLGGSIDDTDEDNDAVGNDDVSAANPWEDLQKQLEEMEQAGGLSVDLDFDTEQHTDEPAAPSADDASIWDFGSSASDNSDDDMSSDIFSGFGGF